MASQTLVVVVEHPVPVEVEAFAQNALTKAVVQKEKAMEEAWPEVLPRSLNLIALEEPAENLLRG